MLVEYLQGFPRGEELGISLRNPPVYHPLSARQTGLRKGKGISIMNPLTSRGSATPFPATADRRKGGKI